MTISSLTLSQAEEKKSTVNTADRKGDSKCMPAAVSLM